MQIPLKSDTIQSYLTTEFIGRYIIIKDSISSTNEYAREQHNASGTVILAEEQTSGKGRMGRIWSAPKGSSILMSIDLQPARTIDSLQVITLAAGLAVAETIRELYLLPARLKWPNDVTLYERKVCGVLTESVLRGNSVSKIIVGLGCNVNQHPTDFPDDLRMPATSLKIDANRELDRNELVGHVLNAFERRYHQVLEGDSEKIVMDWKKNSNQLGKTVRLVSDDREKQAVLKDINPDGSALVEYEDGTTEMFLSGDLN